MGLLDLPSPVFALIDGWLSGALPPLGRLLVWAAVGAVLSIELYRAASPQRQIARVRRVLGHMQQRMIGFDRAFSEEWTLIRRMFRLALRQVALVLPASVLASLPVLLCVIWIDTHYGTSYPPPGTHVSVRVPGEFEGRWIEGPQAGPRAAVFDPAGSPVAEVPIPAPSRHVGKWQWWNALVGNPAGYLRNDMPVDRIDIALPRQQFLPFGPDWLRGWEPAYFGTLMLFALAFKTIRRIE